MNGERKKYVEELFINFFYKNCIARYKILSMFKHSRHCEASDCIVREKPPPLKLMADVLMF